ncbi:hypothetical protein PV325_008108 [Microctonus aethiopoides]|uniref:Uncharacterized protein n=1 Tax=Microctonus aethiopoides TaxID=144406 RepID=A0AA39FLY3_9HYME|nr:hypothetical protein PV325_008108 [Microctonus aethiopoides]KAK0093834.1 hypothetical protein PV326_012513 [Microctonus aethiopoides]KAK0171724.1 hypothetical protein PV328_005141 [Microctonus aethiopoides]
MALSLAIPLSGMEFCHFYGILNRCELLPPDQLISPVPSTLSDSSGISSLTPHTDITTSSLSPISDYEVPPEDNNYFNANDQRRIQQSSRMLSELASFREMEAFYRRLITPSVSSQTHQPIARPNQQRLLTTITRHNLNVKNDSRVMYENRNILNLGANLRGTFWQMRSPTIHDYKDTLFSDNNRMDYSQSPDNQDENYCSICKFCDSS